MMEELLMTEWFDYRQSYWNCHLLHQRWPLSMLPLLLLLPIRGLRNSYRTRSCHRQVG